MRINKWSLQLKKITKKIGFAGKTCKRQNTDTLIKYKINNENKNLNGNRR